MDDPVAALVRWEEYGASWHVVARSETEVTVALYTCDGGEEVDRIVSGDPALIEHVSSPPRSS